MFNPSSSSEMFPKSYARQMFAAGLAGAALALPTPAVASDSQLWTVGTATVKLSDKWSLSQEITARFSNDRDGLYKIESNTLLGYHINKTVVLWAGYTHDPNYSAGHFTVME